MKKTRDCYGLSAHPYHDGAEVEMLDYGAWYDAVVIGDYLLDGKIVLACGSPPMVELRTPDGVRRKPEVVDVMNLLGKAAGHLSRAKREALINELTPFERQILEQASPDEDRGAAA